jgi:prefoldin subunit 5
MKEEIPLNEKQRADVFVEIENCRKNIEFYKEQIDMLQEKMDELERLKEAYEYY